MYKIVGIGDSWMNYCDAIPFASRGLAHHVGDLLGCEVVNLASPGDPTEETLSLPKRKRLEKALVGCDVLLVSSGGDSIAGPQAVLWLNQNTEGNYAEATDRVMLHDALGLVAGCYRDICALRDEIAPRCKIISHVYDVPPVRVLGKGLACFGPWLQPSLDYCGWCDSYGQRNIVESWLLEMANILRIEAHCHANWTVLDTIGVLAEDEWANELHPTQAGFRKIAKMIVGEIMGGA